MNKHSSTALGLTVAIALTTGSVLVEQPSNTDQARGAYSDITIAEADNQKNPPDDGGTAPADRYSGQPVNSRGSACCGNYARRGKQRHAASQALGEPPKAGTPAPIAG